MSSKPEPDRRPWSLAARLTLWYAGSAFVLVVAVTAFLYWALTRSLDREDDDALADKVHVVLALLDTPDTLRYEVDEAQRAFQHNPMFVRVVRPDGRVEAETRGMAEPLPASVFPPPTDQIGTGSEVWTAGGRFRVLAVADPQTGCVVQVSIDRTQDGELMAAYRRYIALALVVALAASSLIGYRIARRGLRPLRAVADTAARIGPTDLSERLETVELPAELLVLADAFNAMLKRLGESFSRLSRFSADIAHELRTPVNNLRGEIEVTLGRPRTPDQYRELLASNLEECGRLTRLIDSLLFLARAENPTHQVAREHVDVGIELATVCEFYEVMACDKGLKLVIAVDGSVHARLNRTFFQRAVCNLVENAISHTPSGGVITLSANESETATTFSVSDTGAGIPPSHLPHVFDRFYRADAARSSEGRNIGLGLSIVKSIADLHGGTVEVQSEDGRGTRVVMTFPQDSTEKQPVDTR